MKKIDLAGTPQALSPDDINSLLKDHVPYRVRLLNDAVDRIPAQNMSDNQAFEAGAVAGRSLLSLLGVGYDKNNCGIRPDHHYHKPQKGMTDDVKAPDIGGCLVDITSLEEKEKELLSHFIQGVHKSSAHFTWGSEHGLDVHTYKETAKLIIKLVRDHLPKMVN